MKSLLLRETQRMHYMPRGCARMHSTSEASLVYVYAQKLVSCSFLLEEEEDLTPNFGKEEIDYWEKGSEKTYQVTGKIDLTCFIFVNSICALLPLFVLFTTLSAGFLASGDTMGSILGEPSKYIISAPTVMSREKCSLIERPDQYKKRRNVSA
ncbi:hypothetical protein llap_6489 [Limosa lapponica baueri]|uniref:Uncharacterized protein n=1 Tax=Limosa lapponica baueri TaxID=1758121 RepID=A0A2I0UB25_LIMLA|nr:hypothetical protein llap_6489 [Limosa lapponica baueri]